MWSEAPPFTSPPACRAFTCRKVWRSDKRGQTHLVPLGKLDVVLPRRDRVGDAEKGDGVGFLGKRVDDLRSRHQVLVLSHARNGAVNFYPGAQTVLRTGDRITVQTEPAVLRELRGRNRDPEPYRGDLGELRQE